MSTVSSSATVVRPGRLVVLTGPSGVGKNRVLSALFALPKVAQRLVYSVSATTRAPRPGEVEGEAYYFMEPATFEALVARGGFLEHAQYNGHHYGTPKAAVQAKLAEGKDVLLEIETQGALAVMALAKAEGIPLASVFILPPSPALATLKARLQSRGTEDEATIAARLAVAEQELQCAPHFEWQVVNDEVPRCAQALAEWLYGTEEHSE